MTIKVFVWFILNYGLMNIIVFSVLFEPFRSLILKWSLNKSIFSSICGFLHELITCPMCFSTWGGFFTGGILWSPVYHLFQVPIGISWFFDGILASGAVWAINSFVEFLEENRINNN